MHEFAAELLPRPGGRDRLARRPSLPESETRRAARAPRHARVDDRKRYAKALTERLLAAVDLRPFAVLGFYWPIRGELDLRGVARRHVEAGGAGRSCPSSWRRTSPSSSGSWEPGTAMQRGFWNIPVPHERRCVTLRMYW